jgi:hypothetical protein
MPAPLDGRDVGGIADGRAPTRTDRPAHAATSPRDPAHRRVKMRDVDMKYLAENSARLMNFS